MPELPEVQTVAVQLAPLLLGRRVKQLELLDPRLGTPDGSSLAGLHVSAVQRCAKRVVIALSRTANAPARRWLCIHLRMTGRLIWSADSADSLEHRGKDLRARLLFTRGALLFYDQRRFGTLDILSQPPHEETKGIEPLSPALTTALLRELLAGSRQEIKAWLLRQDRLAGIGNIYASEILFAASIHPCRQAGSLEGAEIAALRKAVRQVLALAVKHCGTTFSDFQDAAGESGGFARFLKVYQRAGQPCRRCGTAVERMVQQQRSTYYCPHCQQAP